jgi:hypothetical protein
MPSRTSVCALCGGVPCHAVARTGWAGTVQCCDDEMLATHGIARRAREKPSQSLDTVEQYSQWSGTV